MNIYTCKVKYFKVCGLKILTSPCWLCNVLMYFYQINVCIFCEQLAWYLNFLYTRLISNLILASGSVEGIAAVLNYIPV